MYKRQAYAQIHGTELKLTGLYAKEHQWEYVIDSVIGTTENAVQLGEQLAQKMCIRDRPWTKRLNWGLNVFYVLDILENSLSWQAVS